MSGRIARRALLVATLCCAVLSPAGPALAVPFTEFVDPSPSPGNKFGTHVVPLSTGNVVITSPFDDAGGSDAGAVYLFNGATGALISTLLGSGENQLIGNGGVTALTNGNFVVRSMAWDNGLFINCGAATWGSGTTGVSGVVSAANSLVGSRNQDFVGEQIFTLPNGNYVVASVGWDRAPAIADAGAVTWGNGVTGVSGVVSVANSLVGTKPQDFVGNGSGILVLANGNYVVPSMTWDNGTTVNAGAVTWCSGVTGAIGPVSAANSLVGSTAFDEVGRSTTSLTNGNYLVATPTWDNGAIVNAGAVTWGSGTTGISGVISAANSLVGSTTDDFVGGESVAARVTALTNGNYVVASRRWDNGAVSDAGATTWGNGTTGTSGVVSAANSLVGSTNGDGLEARATALTNGNYVVLNSGWNNGAAVDAGAATWGSGTTGVSGVISAANSLVGSSLNDRVGGVTALTNGNYVVVSPSWDNGAVLDAGAATWGNGTTGVSGAISAANSLVGSTNQDGAGLRVTALANGNYVVANPVWNDGAIVDVGAATWASGTTGVSGEVSAANSLVGTQAGDRIGGSAALTALTNGNYVVLSPAWDNGAIANAGAATWGSGTSGVTGAVSVNNSLVGSKVGDSVGNRITALPNGNYVVGSTSWDNDAVANAGAATWGSGTSGVTGEVSAANSLIGSTANDQVGLFVTALSNGNFVLQSVEWDNGALVNAGAATWSTGTTGNGVVSAANSLVGTTANTNLQPIVEDVVNHTFIASFLDEGGGRVRVGPVPQPVIVSAADIPADQGGWVRLTFNRSGLDDATSSPPVTQYGIWRLVPAVLSAITAARPDAALVERVRAALPEGIEPREADGRFYVVGVGSQTAGSAEAFPPGTWELVTSVPALQQGQYVVAVPTISNAAPNTFLVTAHTTTPSIWFVSGTVSGQSIDNLAPAPPEQLTAAYASGQTNLQWDANTENDLGSYRVYRGASADFTPGPGNLLASIVTNSYADVGPSGGYYKVSAVDVNNNESGYALIGPDATVGVGEGGPIAFALHGVRPNPARGNGLHVAFALPTGGAARIELLDVSGRQVRSRDVGAMGTGRHTVNLSAGRSVAPGIYWVRLTQGANQKTARVAVIE